jgi:hypothetical protein
VELAANPSADLFALTDPAARGAPPLLGSKAGETAAATAAAPFDVFLALLAAPLPPGQPLPLDAGLPLAPAALDPTRS